MKTPLFIVFLATLSCNQPTGKTKDISKLDSIFYSANFDTSKAYFQPACLHYKGNPLLTIGQNVKDLDKTLSFRRDPNGKFQDYPTDITDYLSLDDNLTKKQSTGSLNGSMFFSADKKGRIFELTAYWGLYLEMTDTAEAEAINTFRRLFLPCLPQDFKIKKQSILTHTDFIEVIKLYPTPDSGDIDHGIKPHWVLSYEIKLTKNGM